MPKPWGYQPQPTANQQVMITAPFASRLKPLASEFHPEPPNFFDTDIIGDDTGTVSRGIIGDLE